jgi:hypothetical protein
MAHLLMRDVVVNPCLKLFPNTLCGDGGEVTVSKNGVNDGRVRRLLLWGNFPMLAQADKVTRWTTYETCWLQRDPGEDS